MKEYSLALIMLATTLAIAPPSALCDSFGYGTPGSKLGVNSDTDAVRGGTPDASAEATSGAFFFNDLLQGNKSGSRDNSGAPLDLNGKQLVLLSGFDKGGQKSGKSGQLLSADEGTDGVSNEVQRASGLGEKSTTALTETPEPGSLFLLGTVVLGLALVLFWETAKRSTGT